jgi:hypothetical protein
MQIVRSLEAEFRRLHERNAALVAAIPPDKLYWQPDTARAFPIYSCGEHILRSAACVEQTFGGLTANLWDDPFEWTLPETLPTPAHVNEYLLEVEATRQRGFALIRSDADLAKEISAPTGEPRTLISLLVATLARAVHHQGRAHATFRLCSDKRLQ